MATTTNYGWTTPDDTALVKDGASAIRTLGSSVDTTTKNLNPETTLADLAYRSSSANVKTRLGIGSTGQVLTVAGGVPTWATPASGVTFAGVSLYKTANQTFTSGSGTNMTFNTELFDTDGYHDTSTNTDRITIPSGKAGYYLISARTFWTAGGTGQRIGMIRKNAGLDQIAKFTINNQTVGVETTVFASCVVSLAVADFVIWENYQDGTGSLAALGGGQELTSFSAIYLGA